MHNTLIESHTLYIVRLSFKILSFVFVGILKTWRYLMNVKISQSLILAEFCRSAQPLSIDMTLSKLFNSSVPQYYDPKIKWQ